MYLKKPRFSIKDNKSINSYNPTVLKRMFLTISEIPWAGLITLSTIWGSFTLFMYFKSVDAWVVTDISTLLKIAGGATVVSLIYLPILGLILILPGLLVKQFQDLNIQLKISCPISLDEVVFGMLSVTSMILVFFLWPFSAQSDFVKFSFFCVSLCICFFALANLVYNALWLIKEGLMVVLVRGLCLSSLESYLLFHL